MLHCNPYLPSAYNDGASGLKCFAKPCFVDLEVIAGVFTWRALYGVVAYGQDTDIEWLVLRCHRDGLRAVNLWLMVRHDGDLASQNLCECVCNAGTYK